MQLTIEYFAVTVEIISLTWEFLTLFDITLKIQLKNIATNTENYIFFKELINRIYLIVCNLEILNCQSFVIKCNLLNKYVEKYLF